MCDFKKRVLSRINSLKQERKDFYDSIENNKNSPIRMNVNENTRNFYEHTYDRLIKELENIIT